MTFLKKFSYTFGAYIIALLIVGGIIMFIDGALGIKLNRVIFFASWYALGHYFKIKFEQLFHRDPETSIIVSPFNENNGAE